MECVFSWQAYISAFCSFVLRMCGTLWFFIQYVWMRIEFIKTICNLMFLYARCREITLKCCFKCACKKTKSQTYFQLKISCLCALTSQLMPDRIFPWHKIKFHKTIQRLCQVKPRNEKNHFYRKVNILHQFDVFLTNQLNC